MKDIEIIQKLLLEKGRIVKHSDLTDFLSNYSNINNKISNLAEKGFLVNLRRGVYYISKLGSLGYTSISNYIIANSIGEQSFVSFEAALKYHGMFDQGLKKIRSISRKQYLDKTIEEITYAYITVKESSYFGYEDVKVDGGNARVATKERALLDLIEYRRSVSNISLFYEKLKNYSEEIDYKRLILYAENYSQITIKIVGFLLDKIDENSEYLNSLINEKSTSRISENSDKFSNKWRLYYDSALDEHLND
jgi:predicted transcriptional regulator of viral defense system